MVSLNLPQNEMIIRLVFFFGIFTILAILEFLMPRRQLHYPKSKRWFSNLGITFINSFLIRILFPTAAVGVALYAQQNQLGLLNRVWHWNDWSAVILCVIVLDLVIYLQHVMFHSIPIFWRIHRMHHVDLDFDVTTGFRFHPFEILLSMLIKFATIILFGIPALAVMIFEILLNSTSMFSHSNIRLPLPLDKIMRWFIVTPDMHRVHHSDLPNETNSNFGFNLSIWDRSFGTYTAQPRFGHDKMTIGIKSIRDLKFCIHLMGMLWIPFVKENREYPINRR